MKFLNPIYLLAIILVVFLWQFVSDYNKDSVLFFGFTENKETEINRNYPVEVNKILVTTGQSVKKGDILLEVSHIEFEHDINQDLDKIEELKIKEQLWLANRQGDLEIMLSEKRMKLEELESEVRQLRAQQQFQTSLYDDLETVEKTNNSYDPIQEKIKVIDKERSLLANVLNTEIKKQEEELKLGNNPYRQQIRSLNAEINLNKNRINELSIAAPTDGLIGNIHCKEAEHISSFKTLITFYEPRPTLIKGYVHESLIVHVSLNDSLLVSATKDSNLQCNGVVIGLGSRVVEIPSRLRKMPEIKTYGREVSIKIPAENNFLQKEKVVLHFLDEKKSEIYRDIKNKNAIAKELIRE